MRFYLNLPTFLIISYVTRLLILGATVADAIVIIAFSSLYAGWIFLEYKKEKPVNNDILEKIKYLEEQIGATKDKVNSINLSASFRK